jgi:hypothetical protein
MIPLDQIQGLIPDLAKLSPDQYAWVQQLVRAMALPVNARRDPRSDVLSDERSVGFFFLYLVTHHTLSAEPFKKEKFEYAMEKILGASGRAASRPSSRTAGHDLTVDGQRWSFKSEAHRDVKRDSIHVWKWMELGKGTWEDKEEDLRGLCDRFLHHLQGYDRIFILRCLTPEDPEDHHYELLEIPKPLLAVAQAGTFTMMQASTQNPKPGYCRVTDEQGLRYELYFDGGTERKLRLQKLRRDLCVFHAEWRFSTPTPKKELSAGE